MLDFALQHSSPCSIRYPKSSAESIEREIAPLELGKSEILGWGEDGVIITFGAQLHEASKASKVLQAEGLDVGVVNARFVKPLDRAMLERALKECRFVVTLEENTLATGFGAAVLEAGNELGLSTDHVHRLGVPDRFVEHGDRIEILEELNLTANGIAAVCRQLSKRFGKTREGSSRRCVS